MVQSPNVQKTNKSNVRFRDKRHTILKAVDRYFFGVLITVIICTEKVCNLSFYSMLTIKFISGHALCICIKFDHIF